MAEGHSAAELTRRPNAKDYLRALAVEMRLAGKSYRQILETLPLPGAKSSLSLWLRDTPLSESQQKALLERSRAAASKRAESIRAQRIRRQEATIAEARAQIPSLAESELFVAGLTAYWAEGSKAKPWSAGERVAFINSDPTMIRLFLAWLDLIGVSRDRLNFRIHIHETADLEAVTQFWANVAEAPGSSFQRPTLKRHKPSGRRHNRGAGYYGCLVVDVKRSTDLSRRIAGWWSGIAESAVPVGVGSLATRSGVV